MSVDLRRYDGEGFCFSTLGWALYLNLAAEGYGWREAGTLKPKEWSSEDGEWTGAYDWNAGQTVTAPDAAALAKALDCYLKDPNKDKVRDEIAANIGDAIGVAIDVDEEDYEFISSFVAFAEQGEFQIW